MLRDSDISIYALSVYPFSILFAFFLIELKWNCTLLICLAVICIGTEIEANPSRRYLGCPCVTRRKCLMCFVNELLRESTTFSSLTVLKYNRINPHPIDGEGMTLLYCAVILRYMNKPGECFSEDFFSPKWQKKYWLEYDVRETFINPSPVLAFSSDECISPKSVRLLNFAFFNIKIRVKFYFD